MPDYLHQLLSTSVQLAIVAAVFIPLERLFTLRREKILRAEFANDLGYYFLNALFLSSLMALPIAGLAMAANHLVPHAIIESARDLPLWARVPLVLLVGDIGAYWGHRLSHSWPWLWRFHVVHHSPTHVDWLVNTRAHPLDLVFTRLCGLAPLFALGLAQTTQGANAMPALYSLFALGWAFLIHANVRWRFGWLEQLIATPVFHHWHHTNDEWRDHNYAALFPFIDRLFGSLHLPNTFPPVYGVDEPPSSNMLGQLVDPLLPTAAKKQPQE